MTDNEFGYTQSRHFGELLWRRAIGHSRGVYTPKDFEVSRIIRGFVGPVTLASDFASRTCGR